MLPIRQTQNLVREDKENGLRGKPNQRAGGNRRPVLGNVTNQVRKQPQRIAKDKHSVLHAVPSKPGADQENEVPGRINGKKAMGTFAIFEDVAPVSDPPRPALQSILIDEPMHDQENAEPQLHDAVIDLNIGNQLRHMPLAPLQPLQLNERLAASPMVVEDKHEDSVLEPHIELDEFGLDPYFTDIYNYLRAKESLSRPAKDYMNRQTDVTTSMRNILVDWLVEVGEEYKLHRETLFLAVNYIDRFLSLVGVHRPKLQLVGTACMFIAAKYEEIYPPDVSEFVYITDDTYTRNQVIKMESVILKLLEFKVAVPTINWFCERFIEVIQPSEQCKHLAFFLTELTLVEIEEYLDFDPSEIAASAIVLARSTLGEREPWPQSVRTISRYSLGDLEACVRCLFKHYSRKTSLPQQAVVEKYKQDKLGKVSLIEPPHVLAIY